MEEKRRKGKRKETRENKQKGKNMKRDKKEMRVRGKDKM